MASALGRCTLFFCTLLSSLHSRFSRMCEKDRWGERDRLMIGGPGWLKRVWLAHYYGPNWQVPKIKWILWTIKKKGNKSFFTIVLLNSNFKIRRRKCTKPNRKPCSILIFNHQNFWHFATLNFCCFFKYWHSTLKTWMHTILEKIKKWQTYCPSPVWGPPSWVHCRPNSPPHTRSGRRPGRSGWGLGAFPVR